MENKTEYVISLKLKEDDRALLEDIYTELMDEKFSGWNWDQFVVISLQTFDKLLSNGLSPDQFDYLLENADKVIKQCKIEDEKNEEKKIDIQGEIIGLKKIKDKIDRLAKLKEKAFWIENSMNYLFVGNPGTGKTLMARVLANEFHKRNIIPTSKLIEVDRTDLIGKYLGQTAPKVRECFKKAEGGVLFIDEAYSLAEDEYGYEALGEINKLIEDYRGKLVVIFAGYKKETMKLLKINPGLKSRINSIFEFDDYDENELKKIIDVFCNKLCIQLDTGVADKIIKIANYQKGKKDYGNARLIRNILEGTMEYWALREPEKDKWNLIVFDDLLNWQVEHNVVIESDVYDA